METSTGKASGPVRITEEMVRLASGDGKHGPLPIDPWHIAANLNAMTEHGYCPKCGLCPVGCEREGCGSATEAPPATACSEIRWRCPACGCDQATTLPTENVVGVASHGLFCVFHGRGGYECERESANKALEAGKQYQVVDVEMHASVTYITLQGQPHSYNTALFEVDHDALYRWAFPQNDES